MKKIGVTILSLFFLTGCWDQSLLNDTKLITAGGFDYTKDGKVVTTASIPAAISPEAGKNAIQNQIFSAAGDTARQSRLRLDRKIAQKLDASKNLIIILGEDAAKEDIYQLLDVFYRDPKSALNAKIAVSKGRSSDVINIKFTETKVTPVGEYLRDLVVSAEKGGTIPDVNIQTICPIMFDPGQDFALPYLESKGDAVKVNGVALFNQEKMVGKINEPMSVIYNLLTGVKPPHFMSTTKKIMSKRKEKRLNFATINFKKNKRIFNVSVSPSGKISARININTAVSISEYPHDALSSAKELEMVEKLLSKRLTKDAQDLIDQLQEMNSDAYGVGRRLMAFHYPVWEKLDWQKVYPTIDYKATVNVKVVGHGIID